MKEAGKAVTICVWRQWKWAKEGWVLVTTFHRLCRLWQQRQLRVTTNYPYANLLTNYYKERAWGYNKYWETTVCTTGERRVSESFLTGGEYDVTQHSTCNARNMWPKKGCDNLWMHSIGLPHSGALQIIYLSDAGKIFDLNVLLFLFISFELVDDSHCMSAICLFCFTVHSYDCNSCSFLFCLLLIVGIEKNEIHWVLYKKK